MHEVCGVDLGFWLWIGVCGIDWCGVGFWVVGSVLWWEVVSGSVNSRVFGVRVGGMASTQARMTARARARAAQQKVVADRKARDEKNMGSLTDYFAAAEQIDAARLTMARALDDIRGREGTLSAAASLAGITTGEARKLLALLADAALTSAGTDSGDDASVSDSDAAADSRDGSVAPDAADPAASEDATTSKTATVDSAPDAEPGTSHG